MPQAVLTLNAGSSSIKFSLFEVEAGGRLRLASRAEVEGLGTAPGFIVRDRDGRRILHESWASFGYDACLDKALAWASDHLGDDTLAAVGHRVVHGGERHRRPERVTLELLRLLETLIPLAPLHQPHNLAPMRAILATRPLLPQIACFDTAFHADMPKVATRFALPRRLDEAGVRRYGFHGLSYEFISRRLMEVDPALAQGRTIVAHLGAGASLCALRGSVSVDTTMGLTALDGLMMGTRCGALDPGVVLYLEQARAMSAEAVERLLYEESGLLGVSGGLSSDMRVLLASEDALAKEAIELFTYRIAREAGALASSLSGLDGFVFTAGIGENAAAIRAMVCDRLAWLGASLDPEANARHAAVISAASSRVRVRVLPTDEEAMIARHTLDLVTSGPTPGAVPRH